MDGRQKIISSVIALIDGAGNKEVKVENSFKGNELDLKLLLMQIHVDANVIKGIEDVIIS